MSVRCPTEARVAYEQARESLSLSNNSEARQSPRRTISHTNISGSSSYTNETGLGGKVELCRIHTRSVTSCYNYIRPSDCDTYWLFCPLVLSVCKSLAVSFRPEKRPVGGDKNKMLRRAVVEDYRSRAM